MSARTIIERPPPPRPPKPLFMPIALGLFVVMLGLLIPLMGSEPEVEETVDEEPPPPTEATVTVRSEPSGATVHIGEHSRGTTPLDLTLPLDAPVTLRVHKIGFVQVEHELTPELGMESIDLALAAAPYVLAIRGVPEDANASVVVNGETPADLEAIALGTELASDLEISVEARGYRPFATTVASAAFEAEPTRRFHALTVNLEPRRPVRRATMRATMSANMETAPAMEAAAVMRAVPSNPF